MVGTGKGAENGVLIRNAQALELASKVRTVALDKTGTITQGRPAVTDVFTVHTAAESDVLAVAAAVEANSEHPLAEAVLSRAGKAAGQDMTVTDFEALPGAGVTASVSTGVLNVGDACRQRALMFSHLAERGADMPNALREASADTRFWPSRARR